jgi:hypothetical protein
VLPVDHNQNTGGTIMATDTDKQQKDSGLDDYGIIYISGAINSGTAESLTLLR